MVLYYQNKFFKYFVIEGVTLILTVLGFIFYLYQTSILLTLPIDQVRSWEPILMWLQRGVYLGAFLSVLGFEYCGFLLSKAKGYSGLWGLLFSLPIILLLKDQGQDNWR